MIGKPDGLVVLASQPTYEETKYPGVFKDLETGLYFWVDEVQLPSCMYVDIENANNDLDRYCKYAL